MPPRPFRSLLLLTLFGLLAVPLLGDVNVQFKTMGLGGNTTGITYKKSGKFTALELLPFSSPPQTYNYSGNNTMPLYRMGMVNDKPQMIHIGNVIFPNGATGSYLVVIAESGGSANGSALSLKNQDFPNHSVRVINATPLALNMTCDTASAVVRPGGTAMFKPPQDHFGMSANIERGGEQDQLAGNLYPINSTMRQTIFVLLTNGTQLQQDPKTEPQVQLALMTDTANPPPAASTKRGSDNF